MCRGLSAPSSLLLSCRHTIFSQPVSISMGDDDDVICALVMHCTALRRASNHMVVLLVLCNTARALFYTIVQYYAPLLHISMSLSTMLCSTRRGHSDYNFFYFSLSHTHMSSRVYRQIFAISTLRICERVRVKLIA